MNSLRVISPYKWNGQWVFDDPAHDLLREPFVAGTDTLLDRVTADINDAAAGFTLIFSDRPFPGHQWQLDWIGQEFDGNTYRCDQLGHDAWLCPALLNYFEQAPQQIFVQIKPR